jgi:hypothetical protein
MGKRNLLMIKLRNVFSSSRIRYTRKEGQFYIWPDTFFKARGEISTCHRIAPFPKKLIRQQTDEIKMKNEHTMNTHLSAHQISADRYP